MKKIIIAVVVIALIGGGALFILSKKTPKAADSTTTNTSNTTAQTTSPNTSNTTTPAADNSVQAAATITYSDNGFTPATTTVKSGDKVTVKNDSSHTMQFSSDPHPVHTNNTELNQQALPPGGSQTFTVTKKGTFGFHDHLRDSHTGTIVIQ